MPGERSSEGAIIAGGAKAAWLTDSEGNILAIIQTLGRPDEGDESAYVPKC